MDKILSFRYISLILYTLYILVGFVPYFGSVDKTATQIVYLNILNCISLALVVGFYKQFERSFKFALSIFPSILFFGYFIWGLLTYFLAFNQTEVLIESGKTFTYLSAFIFFVFLFKTNKSYFLKYFPIIISLILLTETSLVLLEFIDRYKENYTRTLGLRAFTGNINITAFIMVLQIPFYIYQAKKWKFLKIFFPVIFFTVILLGSRGANLSILLVLIIFVLLTFIKRFKVISKKNLVQIILSFVIAIGINNFLFDKNEDIKEGTSVSYIDRTTNLNTSSTQQRLRFYGDAIQSIKKNFFFGIGLGNWKIESIIYDKPHMKGYKVPYHVHNDFLEVFSETGIIGFILYFGIAFIAIFIVWKKFSKKHLQTNNEFLIVISISLLIFLIDSFLNFPYARAISQIHYFSILAGLFVICQEKLRVTEINKFLDKSKSRIGIFFILFSILLLLSLISSIKVYDSFVNQNFLMVAGRGKIKNYNNEFVEAIDSKYPNITATAVPIESLKANLLLNNGVTSDTIVKMLNVGRSVNPHFNLEDAAQAVYYIKNQEFDSAFNYAQKAFFGLPNHRYHYEIYTDLIEFKKDSIALNDALSKLRKPIDEEFYKKYLAVSASIKNSLSDDRNLIDTLNQKFPESKYFNLYATMFKVGKKNLAKAIRSAERGEVLFKDGKYEEAYEKYDLALTYNPNEPAYFVNAANCLMKIGENLKAKQILEELNFNLGSRGDGNENYLLGLIYANEKDYKTACDNFNTALKKGFKINQRVIELVCNAQ